MNQMNDDDFSQCTTTRSQLLGFSIYELFFGFKFDFMKQIFHILSDRKSVV